MNPSEGGRPGKSNSQVKGVGLFGIAKAAAILVVKIGVRQDYEEVR
jgi:hypothetical protein